MQPRTLEAILSELNPIYEPQVQSIRTRQSAIPGQIAEEEKGLQAKQANAFDDILGGARRRGLGFSGIPLAEQARYTASEFLPSIARLRQTGREQAMSLEDAILGINERKQNSAIQMRQYEQQRYDQEMARLRAEEEARRARAASAGGFNLGGFGGNTGGQVQQNNQTKAPSGPSKIEQEAYNEVKRMLDSKDDAAKYRELKAIQASAGYGNVKDKWKLIYIGQLTGGKLLPANVLSNGGQLRF